MEPFDTRKCFCCRCNTACELLEYFLRIDLFYWCNLFQEIAIDVVRTNHMQIVYRKRTQWFSISKIFKRTVSKLSKISIPSLCSTNWTLEWRLCLNFTLLSFIFSEIKTVKERYGRVGLDSASHKMVKKIYFKFLIHFNLIFPMQPSEFIKLLNHGSISKKNCKKT